MKACSAIVHINPALGARFTQYTAEFEPGGELGNTPAQRFLFVIEGVVKVEVDGQVEEIERERLCLPPRRFASSRDSDEKKPCRSH